jgi:hypothetical protein
MFQFENGRRRTIALGDREDQEIRRGSVLMGVIVSMI